MEGGSWEQGCHLPLPARGQGNRGMDLLTLCGRVGQIWAPQGHRVVPQQPSMGCCTPQRPQLSPLNQES